MASAGTRSPQGMLFRPRSRCNLLLKVWSTVDCDVGYVMLYFDRGGVNPIAHTLHTGQQYGDRRPIVFEDSDTSLGASKGTRGAWKRLSAVSESRINLSGSLHSSSSLVRWTLLHRDRPPDQPLRAITRPNPGITPSKSRNLGLNRQFEMVSCMRRLISRLWTFSSIAFAAAIT